MASVVANLLSGGLFDGISKLVEVIKGKSPVDAEKLAELTAKYQSDILAADLQSRQMQADVNKIEAASSSMFVAGWRPFIGWVCGSAFAANFVIVPIAKYVGAATGHPVEFPVLDMSDMLPVLFGMLGLGGMRTFEKVNGVHAGH